MVPRVSSSTKWTNLPPELLNQIQDVFSESFQDRSRMGKFHSQGWIYAQEMVLRVGFLENGRLVQNNFEFSMDFDAKKQNALEQIHLAIDCIASMVAEYFETEGELDMPLDWSEYNFDSHRVFLRYSTINTTLEEEANRLLGIQATDLLNENSDVAAIDDVIATPEDVKTIEEKLSAKSPELTKTLIDFVTDKKHTH
jgi:hypothetical protein